MREAGGHRTRGVGGEVPALELGFRESNRRRVCNIAKVAGYLSLPAQTGPRWDERHNRALRKCEFRMLPVGRRKSASTFWVPTPYQGTRIFGGEPVTLEELAARGSL